MAMMELKTIIRYGLDLILFIFFLYGIINYMTNFEKNMCDMTYMFEYPDYIKIPLSTEVQTKFPKYSLYVYGEGKYAERLRDGRIGGVPVLFIPGNAGSSRQVRSLGSVAMRMADSLRKPFHFNFFVADFDGEISALYGGVLDGQTEFVEICIKRIQSLYPDKRKLILVGHSMGGVIARAVFSIPGFDSASVSSIFSLASPHKAPVLALDPHIENFYAKLNDVWTKHMDENLNSIPVVSIGGGTRDIVVRSDLTTFPFVPVNSLHIHTLTTSIPGVWVSTDHLAIVWCKQLVLTVARSLFDIVDSRTNEVITNKTHLQKVLHHHYIKRSRGPYFPVMSYIPQGTFSSSGQWLYQDQTLWRISHNKVISTTYVVIPLFEGENIITVACGVVKDDWIFGCNAKRTENGQFKCSHGENLSDRGEIIPTKSKTCMRKMIHFEASTLLKDGHSHIVIYIAPTHSQVDLLGERYDPAKRLKRAAVPTVPGLLGFLEPDHRLLTVALSESSIFYNITLPHFSKIHEAGTVVLETRICKAGSVLGQGIIRLHFPWSHDDHYFNIRTMLGGQTIIPVKLQTLPPEGYTGGVQLHVILDPECSYIMYTHLPISQFASEFLKFFGTLILGTAVAILLGVLSRQLSDIGTKGVCSSTADVLKGLPAFSVLLFPIVLSIVKKNGVWPSFLPFPDRVTPGDSKLHEDFFIRFLLYLIVKSILLVACLSLDAFIVLLVSVWIRIRHSAVLKATEKPIIEAHRSDIKLEYPLFIVCFLLCGVAISISSSAAFSFGTIFMLGKLLSMRGSSKAEEDRRGPSHLTRKWHFYFTLTLLWLCAAALLLPGNIMMLKGAKFYTELVNDAHKVPVVTLLLTQLLLSLVPVPYSSRVFYKSVCLVVNVITLLTGFYGLHAPFRLVHFICIVFTVVAVHQHVIFILYPNEKKIQ